MLMLVWANKQPGTKELCGSDAPSLKIFILGQIYVPHGKTSNKFAKFLQK